MSSITTTLSGPGLSGFGAQVKNEKLEAEKKPAVEQKSASELVAARKAEAKDQEKAKTQEDVQKVLSEAITEALEKYIGNSRLSIEKHSDAGRFVYKAVDAKTGEVKRQWPQADALEIMAYYRQSEGVVVDSKV